MFKQTEPLLIAGIPISKPTSAASGAVGKQFKHFWIEAGSLTGGSGNQLDLSRVSRFNRIAGSLTLFGLSSSNIATKTSIRIRYKGVDYDDNHILFPMTASGKSNQTWRMQLNGVSSSGDMLTAYCASDFVGKVLVFKELGMNHYEITTVNASAGMKKLISISKQWDQNRGGNGRHFGEL